MDNEEEYNNFKGTIKKIMLSVMPSPEKHHPNDDYHKGRNSMLKEIKELIEKL